METELWTPLGTLKYIFMGEGWIVPCSGRVVRAHKLALLRLPAFLWVPAPWLV